MRLAEVKFQSFDINQIQKINKKKTVFIPNNYEICV